jgi:hypothetical protein
LSSPSFFSSFVWKSFFFKTFLIYQTYAILRSFPFMSYLCKHF